MAKSLITLREVGQLAVRQTQLEYLFRRKIQEQEQLGEFILEIEVYRTGLLRAEDRLKQGVGYHLGEGTHG